MKEVFISTGIGIFSYFCIRKFMSSKRIDTAICVLNDFGTVRFTQMPYDKTLVESNLVCDDTVTMYTSVETFQKVVIQHVHTIIQMVTFMVVRPIDIDIVEIWETYMFQKTGYVTTHLLQM